MRIILAAVLSALSLCACSPGGEPASVAAPEQPAPVMLGSVDLNQPLRALGTEPFWGIEIGPEALTYSGIDQPEIRADHSGPVVQGTTAVYAATAQGAPVMTVTLISTECSDGMSDRTYPLTAMVEIGERKLNGCAAPQTFLDSTDESGAAR